jgi:hypothetical protein
MSATFRRPGAVTAGAPGTPPHRTSTTTTDTTFQVGEYA